jgi:amidohydrolase
VPGFFFTVGVTPVGKDTTTVPSNHSSQFFMDEGALPIGLRALLGVTLDYLRGTTAQPDTQ